MLLDVICFRLLNVCVCLNGWYLVVIVESPSYNNINYKYNCFKFYCSLWIKTVTPKGSMVLKFKKLHIVLWQPPILYHTFYCWKTIKSHPIAKQIVYSIFWYVTMETWYSLCLVLLLWDIYLRLHNYIEYLCKIVFLHNQY